MSELAGDQPVHKAPPLPSMRAQEIQPYQRMQPGKESWITDFRPVALPADSEGDLVTGPKAKVWSAQDSAQSEDSAPDQPQVESASAEKDKIQKPPVAPPKPTS